MRSDVTRGNSSRRGLAMLELVLSLPILLGVMALMIDFGFKASWRIRAHNTARDAVWSSRWPRMGANPRPVAWPVPGSTGTNAGTALDVLDDPSIDQPVARGPNLGQTQVNRDLLDPTRGAVVGWSNIDETWPMLAGVLGNKFNVNVKHPLLDDGWQYPRMGMGSNRQRRMPIIYKLAKASPALVQAFVGAVSAVYIAPFRAALAVLDRDAEIFAFYGYYPDFHPRLPGFCSLDVKSIHDDLVLPLIDRIQGRRRPHVPGVPENLARFFLGMYRAEIANLNAATPPAPPGQIAVLQSYVNQLTAFLGRL